MTRGKLIRRGLAALVALVLLAGIFAPLVKADRMGNRIRQALERSLGRRVEIGKARLNIFSGPGFTVEDVIIYEDPAFGLEPFAHVLELDARVSLMSLWTGRLEFSKLRLEEPSVNLVRRSTGGWNLLPLVERTAEQSKAARAPLPSIEVRSGRLYFKLDDTKSEFYVANADVDVSPRSGGLDGFDVSFEAGPGRTDRRAYSAATFRGSGRVGVERVDVNLELARTNIGELVRLVRGHDLGVHGHMTSTARLSGPLSNVQIKGTLRIDDIHRWDLMPRGGGWSVPYKGNLNWRAQRATIEMADPAAPVKLGFTVANWLSKPQWRSEVAVAGLASQSVIEFARHLGAAVPERIAVSGTLDGVASYTPADGWSGEVILGDSDFKLGDAPQLRLAQSRVQLAGSRMQYGPAAITGEDGQAAELQLDYDPVSGAAGLQIRAESLSIAELQSGSGHLLSVASVPLMEDLRQGRWTGWLRYDSPGGDAPGVWSGKFDVRDVLTRVPGFSDPLRLRSASVELNGARAAVTRIRGRAGKIDFLGDYRYEPNLPRPHRFNVTVPELQAGDLERLLLPTLRREQGFFARTLRWRRTPPPEWLVGRHAEGTVRVGLLALEPVAVRGLRGSVTWEGTSITVALRDARALEGALRGTLTADVSGAVPQYRFEGALSNGRWHGGALNVDGKLASAGTGLEVLTNLHASGKFNADELEVLPDASVRTASGEFDLSIGRTGPVLRLTGLQAATPTESFAGEAATQGDGTIRVDLASAQRTMRYVGPLHPLRLDPAVAKP